MIHFFDENSLRVRHIASHVEGEILTKAVLEQMIASNHPGKDDRRDVGIIALPDQIFVRFQFPNAVTERIYRREVVASQA